MTIWQHICLHQWFSRVICARSAGADRPMPLYLKSNSVLRVGGRRRGNSRALQTSVTGPNDVIGPNDAIGLGDDTGAPQFNCLAPGLLDDIWLLPLLSAPVDLQSG